MPDSFPSDRIFEMTLNVTAISKNIVTQASDRRFTNLKTGKTEADEANKALVFSCADALLAITFTGIGSVNLGCVGKSVDQWLAEVIRDEGLCELRVEKSLPIIAEKATEWFETFPEEWDKRHAVILAGWQELKKEEITACLWIISNFSPSRTTYSKRFNIERLSTNKPLIIAMPNTKAIGRIDRRQLKAELRNSKTVDEIEKSVVQLIRRVASKASGVGKSCMSIAISSTKQARATYYSKDNLISSYGPYFLWYYGGRNYCVGESNVMPGGGYNVAFGEPGTVSLVVGGTPSIVSPIEILTKFKFSFAEAKHKVNDQVLKGILVTGLQFKPMPENKT